jgi:aldose sugar dehydrogenase
MRGDKILTYDRPMKRRLLLLLPVLAVVPFVASNAAPDGLLPIVKGLDHPWGMVFLPDGSILVTERPGRLRRVTLNDNASSEPISGIPEVDDSGQGGLLGIALAPDFASSREVFLSFAEKRDGGNVTAVFRGTLSADNSKLENGTVIFRQSRAVDSGRHFGSRLVFDRDGSLFVTTGDRGDLPDEAQNPASHIGKVLRITRDGAPAPGNPNTAGWAPEVWSIGHRNIQGAALHPATGQLWTAEHGARGGDEINTPQAGRNYGWPVITYGRDYSGSKIGEGTVKDGLEQPLHYWDPSIAPSGMAFLTSDVYPAWKGSLFVGGLAGEHLHRLTLDGTKIATFEKLFEGFGRIRDVVQGPSGHIFVLTDEAEPAGAIYQLAASGDVTSTSGN